MPEDNKTYKLQDYIMNGDLDLFQMMCQMIAAAYQNQKKLFEKYLVVEMINDMHHLALVEVSVTYLRLLLKYSDIDQFQSENPTARSDLIKL